MTIAILAFLFGFSCGTIIGFGAACLFAMARDADEEIPEINDDGSLWPRNSKGL
jgi:hypothetical protein